MSGFDEDVALLRRAAAVARTTPVPNGFLHALADWWASEAETLDRLEPFTESINEAIEQTSGIKAFIAFERNSDGRIRMRSDTSQAALAAAQIFLGDQ